MEDNVDFFEFHKTENEKIKLEKDFYFLKQKHKYLFTINLIK